MDDDFEVPGPHDEAVEEAAEKKRDAFAQRIAVMTAILSTVGAMVSYQSGSSQTAAMFLKNQSILRQAEASDKWALYQSRSTKGHIAEAASALASTSELKAHFVAQQEKEEREKLGVAKEARSLEMDSRVLSEKAEEKLKPHERLALAQTFIQIAIALSAITVLTRRRWLLWGAVGSAMTGILYAAFALT